MRQYQRFMRRHIGPLGSEGADALRQTLAGAPGVMDVHSIEPHLKGGYRTLFDLDMARLDAFIAEVERAGWMTVM